MTGDIGTIRIVIIALASFALFALGSAVYLLATAPEPISAERVAGIGSITALAGTALGALGAVLVSTRTGEGVTPAVSVERASVDVNGGDVTVTPSPDPAP